MEGGPGHWWGSVLCRHGRDAVIDREAIYILQGSEFWVYHFSLCRVYCVYYFLLPVWRRKEKGNMR